MILTFCFTHVLSIPLHHPLKGIAPTKVTTHKSYVFQPSIKHKGNKNNVSKLLIAVSLICWSNFYLFIIICILYFHFNRFAWT